VHALLLPQDAVLRREGSLQAYAEVLISDFHRVGDSRCALFPSMPMNQQHLSIKTRCGAAACKPCLLWSTVPSDLLPSSSPCSTSSVFYFDFGVVVFWQLSKEIEQ